jgi:phosphomannomutase
MALNAELKDKITEWIAGDVSEKDKNELLALVNDAESGAASEATVSEAVKSLENRFFGMLEFGTAGLRGEMQAGPNRMNRALVIKTAAGLSAFANKKLNKAKIVIGYDARYNSEQFALDSAGVFTSAGLDVHLMKKALPTPLLAYAVRKMHADIGVMVTASHNPGKDNGYKVYMGGRLVEESAKGSQIVPPFDGEIAAEIQKIGRANEVERASEGWNYIPLSIVDSYYSDVKDLIFDGSEREDISIATTAMHGVGGVIQVELLNKFGFSNVSFVKEQQEPDPAFPTVSFPNPEEKGAMDLVLALAEKVNADLVIANDPDADRMAVGIYDKRLGAYRALTGDETGVIIGNYFIENASGARASGGVDGNGADDASAGVVASSIVSSRMLEKLAQLEGVPYEATLTGFKWISRVPNLIFGYEEALGLCVVPSIVHDKDGPTAGAIMAQITSAQKKKGQSISDLLDDLTRKTGLYSQKQVSIRFNSKEKIENTVENLRKHPLEKVGGSLVKVYEDLSVNNGNLPTTNAIRIITEDETRVMIRPSGTEPKVKFYIETYASVETNATFDDITEARTNASLKLKRIAEEFMKLGD